MRYLLPHQHLILDAFVTAVLLTVLGLTSSLFIQALASKRLGAGFFIPSSYLSAHLSRRITAETVSGCHRHPRGLPFTFRPLRAPASIPALIALGMMPACVAEIDVPLPAAIAPGRHPVPIVAEAGGRIHKVYVEEGSIVRQGDPVIQLHTRYLALRKQVLESRIHSAELRMSAARSELSLLYRELRQIQLDAARSAVLWTVRSCSWSRCIPATRSRPEWRSRLRPTPKTKAPEAFTSSASALLRNSRN